MRRWGWAQVLTAALLLTGGVGAAWTYLGHVSQKELKREFAELISAHNQHEGERPVLRGTPVPGNAWDAYREALAGMAGPVAKGRGSADGWTFLSPDTVIQKHESSLKALQRGARSRSAKLVLDDSGASPVNTATWQAYYLHLVARAQIQNLWTNGKAEEALDALFAWLTFKMDLERIGPYHHALTATFSLDLLPEFLRSGSLNPTQLREVGVSLERLEASLPPRELRLRRTLMELAQTLIQNENGKRTYFRVAEYADVGSCPSMLWNSPFGALSSLRLMRRLASEVRSWEDSPLKDQRSRAAEALQRGNDRGPSWIRDERSPLQVPDFELKALIPYRLLRAVACRLAGDPLPPDPYGNELRCTDEDGILRLWSVGANGQDEDGRADDPCLELARS